MQCAGSLICRSEGFARGRRLSRYRKVFGDGYGQGSSETVTRSRVFHGVVRQDLQWFEEEMAGGL